MKTIHNFLIILRSFIIILSAVTAVMFTSCDKENEPELPEVPEIPQEPVQPEKPAVCIDTVNFNNRIYFDNSIIFSNPNYGLSIPPTTNCDSIYSIIINKLKDNLFSVNVSPRNFDIPNVKEAMLPPLLPEVKDFTFEMEGTSNHTDTIFLNAPDPVKLGIWKFNCSGYVTENNCALNISSVQPESDIKLDDLYTKNFIRRLFVLEKGENNGLDFIQYPYILEWEVDPDVWPKEFNFTPIQALRYLSSITDLGPFQKYNLSNVLNGYFFGAKLLDNGTIYNAVLREPQVNGSYYFEPTYTPGQFRYIATSENSIKVFITPIYYRYRLSNYWYTSPTANIRRALFENPGKGVELIFDRTEGPNVNVMINDDKLSLSLIKAWYNEALGKDRSKAGYKEMIRISWNLHEYSENLCTMIDILPTLLDNTKSIKLGYKTGLRNSLKPVTDTGYGNDPELYDYYH